MTGSMVITLNSLHYEQKRTLNDLWLKKEGEDNMKTGNLQKGEGQEQGMPLFTFMMFHCDKHVSCRSSPAVQRNIFLPSSCRWMQLFLQTAIVQLSGCTLTLLLALDISWRYLMYLPRKFHIDPEDGYSMFLWYTCKSALWPCRGHDIFFWNFDVHL